MTTAMIAITRRNAMPPPTPATMGMIELVAVVVVVGVVAMYDKGYTCKLVQYCT